MTLLVVVLGLIVLARVWRFHRGVNLWGVLRYARLREGSLRVGDPAPDVPLTALEGNPAGRLHDWIGGRPLVLIFGSYT